MKFNFAQVARESGFCLRSYKDGHLDWRLVGSVEIERLLRDQNLEHIDSVLTHLAEVPLGTLLETNILDTGIAKYFLLSQFAIQYLLFCREFLEETVADLKEAHGSAQMEIATLKRSLSEANSEILQLHKKVTQMEAIHEVIYPCHLCTKNFVSNDALNLHISRKHSNDHHGMKHEMGRLETPATTGKERENDINLINAIKLELEVKHLKERLNNAERKIKESCNVSAPRSQECSGRESVGVATVHSIGIQSNLCEVKENDDVVDQNPNERFDSTEQLNVLQENLEVLHQWKKEQQMENVAFIADMEKKFKELKQSLETTQRQRESKSETKEEVTPSSLRDLEELLNTKVEDIIKSSGSKINETINKMEINYNSKLDKLEKQLHILAEQTKQREQRMMEMKETEEVIQRKEEVPTTSLQAFKKEENAIVMMQPKVKEKTVVAIEKENETSFVTTETSEPDMNESFKSQQESSEHSTPSSNTFIKSKGPNNDSEDSSDLSEDLEEEEEKPMVETKKKQHEDIKSPPKKSIPRRTMPKPVTRKAIDKIADFRLMDLGIDKKTKALSQTSKNRLVEELNKKRNAQKNKHPNFYATRNKIKKFVDKLCSTKLPENAGKLLKATSPKEIKETRKENIEDTEDFSTSGEDVSDIEAMKSTNISTPLESSLNSIQNIDFKQRLENILASPIKKPQDNYDFTLSGKQQQRSLTTKPIPMPRKRVMFSP